MNSNENRKTTFPIPGQRLFRSFAAVLLCFAVYELRGYRGMPFYSVIASLQCIQQYTKSMQPVARRRVIGTFVGATWGLMTVLTELEIIREGIPDQMLHYLIVSIITVMVMYSTVVLKIQDMAYFSAVVFLSISMNHIGDANPYLFVYHRTMDTVIGVAVAEIVNRMHLPRLRNTDTLYVSGIHDTIFGTGHRISGYAKVELNRLIEDGCLFTVSTIQTPATVRELLPDIKLKLPIIAMDGTALYDMEKREFLQTVRMKPKQAEELSAFLEKEGISYFTNTIEFNTLTVRYGEMGNEAIRKLYEQKKVSPYRNFAPRREKDFDQILYFLLVDHEEKLHEVMERLHRQPWAPAFRVTYDRAQYRDGYLCIKLLPAEATQEKMQKLLMERLGIEKRVTFGPTPGAYDVYIGDANKDYMVKKLKRRFEPVSIRGWRNIFRWK